MALEERPPRIYHRVQIHASINNSLPRITVHFPALVFFSADTRRFLVDRCGDRVESYTRPPLALRLLSGERREREEVASLRASITYTFVLAGEPRESRAVLSLPHNLRSHNVA